MGFLKGRNYFRGIGDALHFSKNSYQSDPTRREAGKKLKNSKTYKKRMLTIESSLEAHKRNMGEIWRNKEKYERLGKPVTTGKSQVEYYFVGFLKGRNYFRGIEDALHFSKNSYQSDPTRPEAGKNSETCKNECLPFPTHSHRLF